MKSTQKRAFVADDLKQLLDSPIAFHRILAHASGGALEGLMLSQALYWTKRTKDPEGWFWKTQAQWWDEIALTRYNQETVRRNLRKKKFWEEERRGQQGRIYYRVDLSLLAEAIIEVIDGDDVQQMELLQSHSSDSGNPTAGTAEIQHLHKAESTSKSTSKTSSSNGAAAAADDDDEFQNLLERLVVAGATATRARKVAETAPDEMRRRLEYLPFVANLKNPGAWLCSKLDEEFAPPAEYLKMLSTRRETEQKIIDDKTADIKARAAVVERQRLQEENDELDRHFESLADGEKTAIDETARRRLGALAASGISVGAALAAERRNQLRKELGMVGYEDEN